MDSAPPDAQRIANAVMREEARIVNCHNASFAGCVIDGPLFRVSRRSYPITQVTAEMEIGAPSSKGRATVTRIVAGGAIAGLPGMVLGGAAKKRTDTTRIYLTVRTPDGRVEVKDAPAKQERAARQFMAKLEMAAQRQWPLTSSIGTVLPLNDSSVRRDPQSNFQVAAVVAGVILLGAGLLAHWMLILFAVYVVAAAGLFVWLSKRHTEALEHYRRGAQ
ncbi:hypothetical protein NONO_c37620 [Nocardia nova SH22a]|uniref:Uncharacterized protein n=1 Tax=Nocardia nova SH22a TaxID=1415166 RepID=W5TMT1_9NOCA|nr:hypothetical protein [Nocardia nova]AHH18546.1 hypothetical protein NONO_c37620 [Nocardia nova SH22a]